MAKMGNNFAKKHRETFRNSLVKIKNFFKIKTKTEETFEFQLPEFTAVGDHMDTLATLPDDLPQNTTTTCGGATCTLHPDKILEKEGTSPLSDLPLVPNSSKSSVNAPSSPGCVIFNDEDTSFPYLSLKSVGVSVFPSLDDDGGASSGRFVDNVDDRGIDNIFVVIIGVVEELVEGGLAGHKASDVKDTQFTSYLPKNAASWSDARSLSVEKVRKLCKL